MPSAARGHKYCMARRFRYYTAMIVVGVVVSPTMPVTIKDANSLFRTSETN